jgi:hypothetical protein
VFFLRPVVAKAEGFLDNEINRCADAKKVEAAAALEKVYTALLAKIRPANYPWKHGYIG